MSRKVREFANGVRVYDDNLAFTLRDRNRESNAHEAGEEDMFAGVARSLPGESCYNIGYQEPDTLDQPDGIIIASKSMQRLQTAGMEQE